MEEKENLVRDYLESHTMSLKFQGQKRKQIKGNMGIQQRAMTMVTMWNQHMTIKQLLPLKVQCLIHPKIQKQA